ncbi:MAG: hypothetical protein OSJ63_08475, partial [Bacilli bacterium]|nr:hypothetical protein [Bacilli bacterium]
MNKNLKLFIKTFIIGIIILLILILLNALKNYMIIKSINNHILEVFSNDNNYQVTITTDLLNNQTQRTNIYCANNIMKAEQYGNDELNIVYWKNYNTNEIVYRELYANTNLGDFDYRQWLIEQYSINMNTKNPIDFFKVKLKSKNNTYIFEGVNIKIYYDKTSKELIKTEMPAPTKAPEDKDWPLITTT